MIIKTWNLLNEIEYFHSFKELAECYGYSSSYLKRLYSQGKVPTCLIAWEETDKPAWI